MGGGEIFKLGTDRSRGIKRRGRGFFLPFAGGSQSNVANGAEANFQGGEGERGNIFGDRVARWARLKLAMFLPAY